MSREARGRIEGRGRGRSPHEQQAVVPAADQPPSAALLAALFQGASDEQRAAGLGAGEAAGRPAWTPPTTTPGTPRTEVNCGGAARRTAQPATAPDATTKPSGAATAGITQGRTMPCAGPAAAQPGASTGSIPRSSTGMGPSATDSAATAAGWRQLAEMGQGAPGMDLTPRDAMRTGPAAAAGGTKRASTTCARSGGQEPPTAARALRRRRGHGHGRLQRRRESSARASRRGGGPGRPPLPPAGAGGGASGERREGPASRVAGHAAAPDGG